jgi:hypothetical protein
MPFEFRNYWLLVQLAWHEKMSPRRRRLAWSVLLAIPVLAAANKLCFALDALFYPEAFTAKVKGPVFVIGHARSGTTLTHQLLTTDPRFSWFMTWELAFPSLLQKKFIRWLGKLDRERWGSRLAKRIEAWEDRTFAKGREMHPMGLSLPEEDEFMFVPSVATGYVQVVFPYVKETECWSDLDSLPVKKRNAIMGFYHETIRRHTWLHGGAGIHLCKYPAPVGKLESFRAFFPDARFIVNVRHPYETIPSHQKMMFRNWKASDADPARIEESLAILVQQSFAQIQEPFAFFERHPEVRYAVIDYRELTRSPRSAIEKAYAEIGLDLSPELAAALDAEDERRRTSHRPDHRYTLDEFGITRERIYEALAPCFERFGWEK